MTETNRVICGDAFDVLADLSKNSVHAVVTDPPYGLAFMGRDWDDFEPKEYQEWCEVWAGKAMRVLKPGGHLLAFSGNRTHHRLFSGVEDAGFEIRDTLTWHYGSGFPKALDVSKAIDKAAGVEPDSVEPASDHGLWSDDSDWNPVHNRENYDSPTTDAAREWDGWKTALKPATEFIVLARKPFEGTVAENVQAHGTGALNIDGTRIDANDNPMGSGTGFSEGLYDGGYNPDGYDAPDGGRYPANVVFDAEAAEALDREVGEVSFNETAKYNEDTEGDGSWYGGQRDAGSKRPGYGDTGGPSRYFKIVSPDGYKYTSKATRAERTLDGAIENAHPTVKPVDLMEWLVRLVTAEGQTVLDPFAGTGTTGRAAKNLNREFVLIEQTPEWCDVARARCGLTPEDPSLLSDEDQSALGKFIAADDNA